MSYTPQPLPLGNVYGFGQHGGATNSPSNTLVPMVLERTGNGERSCDIYSMLLNKRIICVKDGFNAAMASVISAQLLYLDSVDSKRHIELHINSPGGEIYSFLDILTTINKISAPVHTFATGLAASCGSILFNVAAPGKRFMGKYARQMIHQPSSGAQGTVTDMKISIAEAEHLKTVLTQLYVEKNSKGLTYEQIAELMERDRWLSAEESVKLGFADAIIG